MLEKGSKLLVFLGIEVIAHKLDLLFSVVLGRGLVTTHHYLLWRDRSFVLFGIRVELK